MSRLKGLRSVFQAITQRSHPQVTPIISSKRAPSLSYRYLVSAASTSEHTDLKNSTVAASDEAKEDVKNSTVAASDEAKGDGNTNSGDSSKKPVRGGPVTWLSLLLLIMTGGGIIAYYDREKKRHLEELKNVSGVAKQGPSVGTAAIGGPFKLVNHEGKSVSEKDFVGRWTLLYFGFTHCPDICPDELQKLAAAVDKIKAKAGLEILPVFISVDPERDTVEQVHDYVKEFHPSLVGLTGTPEEVRQVARAYRVYYMKTEEEGDDYLVDHSIVMYLMDPNMQFIKFFGKNYDADTLAEGIIKEISEYRK